MKITKDQIKIIEEMLPKPRKKAKISNEQFIEVLIYMLKNGCKSRALPENYVKWHTVYMRFNRWSKKGIIEKIFLKLQEENIVKIDTDIFCIDSTSVKVHPDGTGALKTSGKQNIGRSKGGSQRKST